MENLLDKKQLAEKLKISVKTIDLWVRTKKGPRHFKIGKLVRFKVKDVEEFIDNLTTEGKSE